MKSKSIKLILSLVIIVLLFSIVLVVRKILNVENKEVKVAKEFIEELYYGGIIDYTEGIAEEEQALNKSNKKNSNIKYSVMIGNYGVDIDSEYNILAFSNKNVAGNGTNDMLLEKAMAYSYNDDKDITEDEAVYLAESYLNKITKEKYTIKKVKVEDKKSPIYKISFYKYKEKYPYYKEEINISINKNTGKLEAYTNYPILDMKYIEDISITEQEAINIIKNNYADSDLNISIDDKCKLAYVTVDEKEMVLAYIFNIEKADEESVNFVRADNGQILNNIAEVIKAN